MKKRINITLYFLLILLILFTGFSVQSYKISPDFLKINDLGALSVKTHLNIDQISFDSDRIVINGWAILEGSPSMETKLTIILVDKENLMNYRIFEPDIKTRVDVTEHFNNTFNYDSSGFELNLPKDELKKGTYRIGVQLSIDSSKYQLIGKESIQL